MSERSGGKRPSFLKTASGRRLAYVAVDGRGPTVVFCPGYRSDMTGQKATHLQEFCELIGVPFVRFDYSGHGASDGDFEAGTIGAWRDDLEAILSGVVDGPAVLVGSSMGAWIAALAALRNPDDVVGLVGIAAAPDFTHELIDEATRDAAAKKGVIYRPSDYGDDDPITHRLIEEASDHLILRGPIALDMPVRLFHGTADRDVPWTTSERLLDRLTAADATLTLIKGGDHRLRRPEDLAWVTQAIGELAAD